MDESRSYLHIARIIGGRKNKRRIKTKNHNNVKKQEYKAKDCIFRNALITLIELIFSLSFKALCYIHIVMSIGVEFLNHLFSYHLLSSLIFSIKNVLHYCCQMFFTIPLPSIEYCALLALSFNFLDIMEYILLYFVIVLIKLILRLAFYLNTFSAIIISMGYGIKIWVMQQVYSVCVKSITTYQKVISKINVTRRIHQQPLMKDLFKIYVTLTMKFPIIKQFLKFVFMEISQWFNLIYFSIFMVQQFYRYYFYVDRIKWSIYSLYVSIPEIKVNANFMYSTNSTCRDLHEFINNIFKTKHKVPSYVIFANKSKFDLNDLTKYDVLLSKFHIHPASVVVLLQSVVSSTKPQPLIKLSEPQCNDEAIVNCLHINIQMLNVNVTFNYGANTLLSDLHTFIKQIFKSKGKVPNYRIIQPLYVDALNNASKFHIPLSEFNIPSKSIKVIPRYCYHSICGGGLFKNKKKKFTGRKRKHSDMEKNAKHKNNLLRIRQKKLRKNDKACKFTKTHCSFLINEKFNEQNWLHENPSHDAGSMNNICKKCNAKMFKDEQLANKKGQFSLCCGNGVIKLPLLPRLPNKLREYLTENTVEAKYFRTHIRQINASLAFASIGCNDRTLPRGSFKIQGQVFHRINSAFTESNKFASIFFYDTDNELSNRMKFGYMPNTKTGKKVIKNLQKIIHELNPFYQSFKTAIERQTKEKIPSLQIILKAEMKPAKHHKGCYNNPTTEHVSDIDSANDKPKKIEQIAAIIPGYGLEHSERDIVLYCKNELDAENDCYLDDNGKYKPKLVRINQLHPHYDPTQYVTMFPHGTYGWSPDCIFTERGYEAHVNNNQHSSESNEDKDDKDVEEHAQAKRLIQCHCNYNKCKCQTNENNCHREVLEHEQLISELNGYLSDCSGNFDKVDDDGDGNGDGDSDGNDGGDVDDSRNRNGSKMRAFKRQKLKNIQKRSKKKRKRRIGNHFVKCRKYYKYRTMIRESEFNYLHRYGKLWQQYIVDNWAKVDDNDLNYLQDNQKTIRRAYAAGLEAAIENDEVKSAGIPTILPRSHVGSPRWFHDKFQDAMSIIAAYKKPDLFITFTCNPKWKEITDNLFNNQSAYDRPDLVARVFNIKKQQLLDDIIKNGVFGRVVAHVEVVEFQKRGLPHIHLLVILDKNDSMKNCDEYDAIVSAEIPDPKDSPILYERVMSHMIHFHTKQCWVDNTCTKHFPKDYCDKTTTQQDGYPVYKRRSPDKVCLFTVRCYISFFFTNNALQRVVDES